jgi:hypothetical protein
MIKILLGGICISSIIFLLNYPFFTPPKQIIENKMPKKDWGNINSFQKRIKIKGQLQEIEKAKQSLLNKRGSKRRNKNIKKKTKRKTRKYKKKNSKKHL